MSKLKCKCGNEYDAGGVKIYHLGKVVRVICSDCAYNNKPYVKEHITRRKGDGPYVQFQKRRRNLKRGPGYPTLRDELDRKGISNSNLGIGEFRRDEEEALPAGADEIIGVQSGPEDTGVEGKEVARKGRDKAKNIQT